MPEVIGAFLRAECGHKRADPARETRNGWFGSFPEMCLEFAEGLLARATFINSISEGFHLSVPRTLSIHPSLPWLTRTICICLQGLLLMTTAALFVVFGGGFLYTLISFG
jgi:hypothetical protein